MIWRPARVPLDHYYTPLVKVALSPASQWGSARRWRRSGTRWHLRPWACLHLLDDTAQVGDLDARLGKWASPALFAGDAPLAGRVRGPKSRGGEMRSTPRTVSPHSTTDAAPDTNGKLDPGVPMTHAVETCVHCGFFAACPTYANSARRLTPLAVASSSRRRCSKAPCRSPPRRTWTVASAWRASQRRRSSLSRSHRRPFRFTQSQMKRTLEAAPLRRRQTIPFPRGSGFTRLEDLEKMFRGSFGPAAMISSPDPFPRAAMAALSHRRGERRARGSAGCAQRVLDPLNTARRCPPRHGVEVVPTRLLRRPGPAQRRLPAAQFSPGATLMHSRPMWTRFFTNARSRFRNHEYHLVPAYSRRSACRGVSQTGPRRERLSPSPRPRWRPAGTNPAAQDRYHDACHSATRRASAASPANCSGASRESSYANCSTPKSAAGAPGATISTNRKSRPRWVKRRPVPSWQPAPRSSLRETSAA